jgi:hypothetical protein
VTPDRRATEASLGRAGPVLYEVTANHYMCLCGVVPQRQWEFELQCEPVAGSRLDREFATGLAQALLHAEKAKTFSILD